jgi:beta-phosphoglucomutase-like phosphatase (HAD superfamily)
VTRVLLCDADGCLFPSEEPAFVASTEVTNRFLADLGIPRRFAPAELQAYAVGKNFRATAVDLATAYGVELDGDELERWVQREREAVIEHLQSVLRPDPAVIEPLTRLRDRFGLAVVSSSALPRLAACFTATDLDALLPPDVRFSAEDSLPVPTSKPDPAVYAFAGRRLGVTGADGLAIEDSPTGARSAVAAGFPTVGNLTFVPEDVRPDRAAALQEAGVEALVESWDELEQLLERGLSQTST